MKWFVSYFSAIICIFCLRLGVLALPKTIRIGGLFDAEDDEQHLIFQIAADSINNEKRILPQSRLIAYIENFEHDDSFKATGKVCSLLQLGIAGIFGPQSEMAAAHIQSISDAVEMAHIETRWDYKLRRDDLSVNLYPMASLLNQAYMELVKSWGWTKFYLLYEENEGIIRLQDFLKSANENDWQVQLYQFSPGQPYRDLFWQIKMSASKWVSGDTCIILDVPGTHLKTVLKHAQQVGMITERNKYMITSLDLHAVDLEDFQYSKTNIAGFRLVSEESFEYQKLLSEMNVRLKRKKNKTVHSINTASAMLYDAVWLFAGALHELDASKEVDEFPSISCDGFVKGTDGTSLINYMKSSKVKGVTGLVHFDGQGFRSSFSLDIMQLTTEGLKKAGTMLPGAKINITKIFSVDDGHSALENKKYIITTIRSKPFAMLKDSPKELSGNDRYEGFSIDLIEALSKQLRFRYEIREVADQKHGVEVDKDTGTWNGMIGEVLKGDADMAVADLTITSTREGVLDFTTPFMNTGISILFKKPTEKVKSLFSFLSPFSTEVWIYVMGSFVGVSSVLFVVGRLSPYEWENPHPCRQEDIVMENTFTMLNSMWFTIGSLMQQGCEVAPRAASTRTIAGIWYFFTLIMISSYTANLAAFLTIEKVVYPIENAEDLSKQVKIKYGCLGSGSTRTFFETSNIPTFSKMWKFMKQNPEVLMASNEKGKERVYQGGYAYLMESASIEFLTERECNLTQIGGLLDHKGYGIATKKGNGSLSAWLSSGILKLQEDGILHSLKERWWKQKRGGGQCNENPGQSGSARELGLGNVGGVFVVLLTGILMAVTVAALEFLWKFRKLNSAQREPVGKMMMKELQFALTCGSSVKELPKYKRSKEILGNSQSTTSDFNVPL